MWIRVVCTLLLVACAEQVEPARVTLASPTPVAKTSATVATATVTAAPPPAASAAPTSEPTELEAVSAGQSRAELANRALFGAVRPCREAALRADPKLEAKAKLEIDLRADGTVDHASFVSPGTLTSSTQACVVAAVRGVALPPLGRKIAVWVVFGP